MQLYTDIMGWLAVIAGISMFMPQVVKILITKDGSSLSQTTFFLSAFASALWALYGASAGDINYQAWACNFVIASLMLIIFYFIFDKKWFIGLSTLIVAMLSVSIVLLSIDNISIPVWLKYVFISVAGSLTGTFLVPQIIKTIKTKDVHSLSKLMLILNWLCNGLWLAFWIGRLGISPRDVEYGLDILGTTFTALALGTVSVMLYLKTYYDKRNSA